MSRTIKAQFESRRDAEMVVEHLVQEHGIDRNAIRIGTEAKACTAGMKVAGADIEGGRAKTGTEGSPALGDKITVYATVDAAQTQAVIKTYATYDGAGVAP